MNIVFFAWRDIKNPWAGGSELNIHQIAKEFVSSGHQVRLFTCRTTHEWTGLKDEIVDGIQIIRRGNPFTLYIWAVVYYLLKLRKSAEVVIDVENGIPFFTPLFCFKKKICFVNHVHKKIFFSESFFPVNVIGYVLESFVMPIVYRNEQFVALSQTTADALVDLGVVSQKIVVVFPGVDHRQFYPDFASKYASPTVLYLGKVKRYKNLNSLIDSMILVREKVADVELIIAGEGYDLPQIEERVRRENLSWISVVGRVDDELKRVLYQKAWLYATPSKIEGWGLTVIEANACGTPVVGYRVPGLSDSIRDGVSGYLANSFEEFTNLTVKVLTNDNLRGELSRSAVRYAAEYSWDTTAKKLFSVISKLFENKD